MKLDVFLTKNRDAISKFVDLGEHKLKNGSKWHKCIIICEVCGKSNRVDSFYKFTSYNCKFCNSKQGGLNFNYYPAFISYAITKGYSEADAKDIYYKLKNKLCEIVRRCYSNIEKDKGYKKIPEPRVCDEWRYNRISFYKWCLDNGYPKLNSVDRINPRKGYSPENCRLVCEMYNSINNAEYLKHSFIMFYKDCGLYLSLNQRAKWLGYADRCSLKRKNFVNIGILAKSFNPKKRKVSYFENMSFLNEKLLNNKVCTLKAVIAKDKKTMSYSEFEKLKNLI